VTTSVDARRHALTFVQPLPPVLSEAAPWGVDPGPALAAWSKWAAVPDPGAPLTAAGPARPGRPSRADAAVTGRRAAVAVRGCGCQVRRTRRGLGSGRRSGLGVVRERRGRAGRPGARWPVKAAEAQLKAATDEIRNQRLATQAKTHLGGRRDQPAGARPGTARRVQGQSRGLAVQPYSGS